MSLKLLQKSKVKSLLISFSGYISLRRSIKGEKLNMASIINALRNISGDNWWAVKIPVMALPVFFILNNNGIENIDADSNILMFMILGVIYLGCSSILMNRNINNKSPLLPSLFSIPELFIKSIGMSLVSLPLFIVYFMCIKYINANIILEPFIMWVIYICVTLFMAPFIFIPAVLYSVNGKITDAFYFKSLIEGGGNFSVQFLSFIIQYIFTIFLFALLLYHLFINMLNDMLAINIVYSLTVVISILSLYSYCSDLYGDVIPVLPQKKKRTIKKAGS